MDENYEWDSHYISMHPVDLKTSDGLERKILSEGRLGSCALNDSRPALNHEKKGGRESVIHITLKRSFSQRIDRWGN